MHDAYDSRIEEYNEIYLSTLIGNTVHTVRTNTFNITNLVKAWYSGVPNYGIMLKSHKEIYNSEKYLASVFSKNNTVTGDNPKPILIIHYRNQNGLENYMDYQTQNFTEGSTNANLYNGNLVTTLNVGETISGKFPVSVNLIHNTNDVILESNYGYGLGWQINFHQLIKEYPLENLNLLEYKDGDGTLHYFYKGSDITSDYPETPENPKVERDLDTYYDEDGLSLTITKNNDDYIMKDNDGNTSLFCKKGNTWYLTQITDTSNNKVQIEYEDANRINKIIDGNGEEITITYSSGKDIIKSPNKTVTLYFQNNQLINKIETKNGTTNITYNDKKLIENIIDITGKTTKYEYYDTIPYRLKKISEYGINNTLGTYVEMTYGFNTTTIKDSKELYTTYTFNNNGNTVGITNLNQNEEIKDAYGKSVIYGQKDKTSTSFGSMNKIISENSAVKVVKNYLQNSSFEKDTKIFSGNYNYITTDSVTGERSLNLDGGSTIEQTITVPKGNYYTFSAYMNVESYAEILLSYLDENGNMVFNASEVSYTTKFERQIVTIYYPKNATSDLKITISTFQNNMWCYIDDIQLEEGEVANLYNLIDNSDFSNGKDGWSFTADDTEDTLEVVTLSNNTHALKWHVAPSNSMQTLEKEIPISGKAGDTYTIYFWYKNTGIDKRKQGLSGEKVMIQFNYNYVTDPSYIYPRGNYTDNNTEWQFFEVSFTAQYDYSSIKLLMYDHNANDLYLTNFALYKPISADGNYKYDSNGNMTYQYDPMSGTKEFTYDKNNQLISMMDVKGSNFIYEYDNTVTDRVISGTSGTGITSEIEYDQYGNPIITRITNKHTKDEISGKYYIRMKGTKEYLDCNINNSIELKENTCSHDGFILEKEEDYYKISSLNNPKYKIKIVDEYVVLNKDQYSLFELVKNTNGSYTIKLKREDLGESKPDEPQIVPPRTCLTGENGILRAMYEKEEDPTQQFYLEERESKLFVENTAEYTEDGKFIKNTKDTLGRITEYDINTETGLMNKITDAKGNSTNYTYNNKEQMTKVEKNGKTVEYEYNAENLLSKIKHGTKEYKFTYDEFLNTKNISIGNTKLITNNYENNNGNLLSALYGNNHTISYVYDDFDRIKKVEKMNDTYTYYYDNLGNIAKMTTNNGNNYKYYYDSYNRLTDYQYNELDLKIKYNYNEKSNVKDKYYNSLEGLHHINYEYNKDDTVTKLIFDNKNDIKAMPTTYASKPVINYEYKNELTYTYDELGRLKEKNLNNKLKNKYHYITKGNRTSFVLDEFSNNDDKFSYKYDELDNITDIYYNNTLINHYEYDNSNQLLKDNDYQRNISTVYTYDNVGNLLSKKEYELNTEILLQEDTYEYNNTNWEDELTKFNNDTITYDQIGNPLTIGNKTLSWINGRQLRSITDNENTISYEYNIDGIRTKKTVNGEETTYYLENNHIIYETTPKNMIYYKRDENNNLVGFRCKYDHYYYVKNAQGDIIGILDSNYERIVNYKYDAWGKIISITDNNGNEITDSNHIAHINPFRYRSYYYDEETELYYLNSRYYNPNWGRFINADGIIGANDDVISHNLYAYVSNNYSNMYDSDGNIAAALPWLAPLVKTAVEIVAVAGMTYLGSKAVTSVVSKVHSDSATRSLSKTQTATLTDTKSNSVVSKNLNNHNVYYLRDKATKKIEYVGRTTNIDSTIYRHGHNPNRSNLDFDPVIRNVDKSTARGLEEMLIIQCETLNKNNPMNNQIHGVSLRNPNYKLYMKLAQTWADENVIKCE